MTDGASSPQGSSGERIVNRLGRVVLASTHPRELAGRWASLGFSTGEPYAMGETEAVDIPLAGTGLCIVSGVTGREGKLVGWTWACSDPAASAAAVSARSGTEISESTAVLTPLPSSLSPGVTTWLEADTQAQGAAHPNGIDSVDHVVLFCADADAACSTYEQNFGLKGKRVDLGERRHVFLMVGKSMIEIVAPQEQAEDGHDRPWGLAFRSKDLDATVAYLRSAGIEVPEPRTAIQGGRITTPKVEPCGLAIAVLGE